MSMARSEIRPRRGSVDNRQPSEKKLPFLSCLLDPGTLHLFAERHKNLIHLLPS